MPAQPDAPPFPESLCYLWGMWIKLAMGLPAVSEGYPRVTWESLQAWSRQMRIPLEPWEADTLVTLGVIRANVHNEWAAQQLKAMK